MLTPRETNIVEAFQNRLEDANALETDSILTEIENSIQYTDPAHIDHTAFINALPAALSRKLTLQGDDPERGTAGLNGALDHQRFTFDQYPQEKELDFTADEKIYQKERENLQIYLNKLQKNEIDGIPENEHDIHVKTTQQTIIDLDVHHSESIQLWDTELERRGKQESVWEAEQSARAKEMKSDFMATRMKNTLPDDRKSILILAEQEWSRLVSSYGF